MTIDPKTRLRLRAAAIMLLLALGWLSAPASLAAWEPDVCEMECCIAEGHCCCATRHAYVKGREPKPGEINLGTESSLSVPCPAVCASSTITARNHLPPVTHTPPPLVEIATIALPHCRDQIPAIHSLIARPSSPRAPPSHDQHPV
ncbi:MAG TPA: hypothetical protein VJ302_35705 [Blastocatellia bacterium]|nr:hypothetical protein [Blastocatellia bacterium]